MDVARSPSRWNPTPADARRIQDELRTRVVTRGSLRRVALVAGVDCSVTRLRVRAAVCVFRFPALEQVEDALADRPVEFPYVPGLLAFRELPAIRAAIEELSSAPDVFLVDGHGLAHPKRFGVASHLGVLLDRPTIGCGKSILVGEHAPLGVERGASAELEHRGEIVGAALRTRAAVKPIYVSIGHRVDLASAIELALACATRRRLPDPIHRADRISRDAT